MITIYKDKKDMPETTEYVELNDIFFNTRTVLRIDERAEMVVETIDHAKLISKYKIQSPFNGVTLDIDCLSTGCKTILNVMYFPDKIFCIKECGDNALEFLYGLEQGLVYSDYALIPFDVGPVAVISDNKRKVISDYEALKEWWSDEK